MRDHGARGSHPITALLDLLGARWALRILWELRDGPLRFRLLAEACGSAPAASLNTRLAQLRRAGIVTRGPQGYALTPEGEELGAVLLRLNAWAKDWQRAWTWQADDGALEAGNR